MFLIINKYYYFLEPVKVRKSYDDFLFPNVAEMGTCNIDYIKVLKTTFSM